MPETYKIVRMYKNSYGSRIIKRGLTLEEAKAHCHDPETSSRTCTKAKNKARTANCGEWFDGYDKE